MAHRRPARALRGNLVALLLCAGALSLGLNAHAQPANVTSSSSTGAGVSSDATFSSSSSTTGRGNGSTSSSTVGSTGSTTLLLLNVSSTAAGAAPSNTTLSSTGGVSSPSSSTAAFASTGASASPPLTWRQATNPPSAEVGVQNIPFAQVTPGATSTRWLPRYGHTIVSVSGTLLMFGGTGYWNRTNITTSNANGCELSPATSAQCALTYLWSSPDLGQTWQARPVPFGQRYGATSALVNGAVLLIAGETLTTASGAPVLPTTPRVAEIWSSADVGATWKIVATNPFSARYFHTSTVDVTTNTLVVIGGWDLKAGRALNDVYTSLDSGVTWTPATLRAPFAARYGAASFWRNGVVFVLGGVASDGTAAGTSDLWRSEDAGASWIAVATHAGKGVLPRGVGPRAFAAAASFAGQIYVFGGATGADFIRSDAKNTVYGDVWMSRDEGETWAWQESVASFGERAGVAAVLTSSTVVLVGGVSRGTVYADVYVASLPEGNPSNDGGVVAGTLGAAAGLIVLYLVLRSTVNYIRAQPQRRREKAAREMELAATQAASQLVNPMPVEIDTDEAEETQHQAQGGYTKAAH